MRKQMAETIFAGFIFLFCAVYLIAALKMPFGSVDKPDYGFVPTVMGICGFLISLGIMAKMLIGKKVMEKIDDFTKTAMFRVAGYMFTVFLFVAFFEMLGILVIFPLLLILCKISGMKGWMYPLLLAVIFTLLTHVVFTVLLGVPMPSGILG